eukprot:15367136-Ditylum_brightwellii.AAC.3
MSNHDSDNNNPFVGKDQEDHDNGFVDYNGENYFDESDNKEEEEEERQSQSEDNNFLDDNDFEAFAINRDADDFDEEDDSHDYKSVIDSNNLEDYVASTFDSDIAEDEESDDEFNFDPITTTNAGEIAYEVEAETETKGMTINSHVLLNPCDSCLSRKHHKIKGSSKHKYFLQQICEVTLGKSIPLLYPEAMMFTPIFWKMTNDYSILGAIPSSFLMENIGYFGFASIPQHICSHLKPQSSSCSTNLNHISFCYGTLTNLSVNHSNTRMGLHKGLTVAEDELGGLKARHNNNSAILRSINSKQVVCDLCTSQKYHDMDFFITLTCNQKKHFGVAPIKSWLDSVEWKKHFPEYNQLSKPEQEEIKKALIRASGGIMLHVWQEVALLNAQETEFVKDLIRASVFDVVKPSEVQRFIDEGIIEEVSDVKEIYDDDATCLRHRCSERCLRWVAPGVYVCRKLNNIHVTSDNTKHVFKPLPNNHSKTCLEQLIQCGLVLPIHINKDGYGPPFKSIDQFFHLSRHIPPTNPSDGINISPVEGYLFTVCRSMQNIQWLTYCGGVKKYVCKYIGKIDEQNFITVWADRAKNGKLITKATFLHNIKITSSKINKDKDKESKRGFYHPQGCVLSLMEMLHVLFKYPEVYTDLKFVIVPTLPLELQSGVYKNDGGRVIVDAAQIDPVSDDVRKNVWPRCLETTF